MLKRDARGWSRHLGVIPPSKGAGKNLTPCTVPALRIALLAVLLLFGSAVAVRTASAAEQEAGERIFAVHCAMLISFTWMDNAQTHSLNYTFTPNTSNILKTYVRFTGTQFLIINRNQFGWSNIRIAIGLDRGQDHPIHEKIDSSAFMLMIPRIDSGEAYSTGIMQFRREDGTKLDPAITRPENIKIWSDTPRGRGFWYGSVTDVSVVSHDQPPL
jgi:hypothetical protein